MSNISKYYSNMMDKTLKHPFYLFGLMSLVALITHGIDIYDHLYRNLNILDSLNSNVLMDQGVYSTMYNPLSLMYYYAQYLLPVFDYGILTMGLAVLYKMGAFIMIYKIAFKFLNCNSSSIIISLVFLLTPNAMVHGLVGGGLWGSPLVIKSSLSLLAILIALYFFLNNSFIVSGLVFGLAVNIHSLYGVTTIAFIGSGILLIAINKYNIWKWVNLMYLIAIIMTSVIYVAYYSYSGYDVLIELPTVAEWYKFTYAVDPDDMSLLWTFGSFGTVLLSLIVLGAYYSWVTEYKTDLEYLMLGSFIALIVFLVIEFFHNNSFYFGFISEYFIAIELRRGVWIVSLFALIVLYKNINNILDTLSQKNTIILVAMLVSVYMAPSIITVFILTTYLLFLFKSRLMVLFYSFVIIMISINVIGEYFQLFQQLKSVSVLLIVLTIIGLINYFYNDVLKSRGAIFTISFTIVTLVYLATGLKYGRFSKSYTAFVSDGFFNKTNHDTAFEVLAQNRSGRNVIYYDKIIKDCMQDAVQKPNSKIKIQVPVYDLTHRIQPFYQQHLYLSSYDLSMPMFSRHEYANVKTKMSYLFGEDNVTDLLSNNINSKADLYGFIEEHYPLIPKKQLKVARDKGRLRFYIIDNKRDILHDYELCSGQRYYVYDLGLM
jgi:hypothetical protein